MRGEVNINRSGSAAAQGRQAEACTLCCTPGGLAGRKIAVNALHETESRERCCWGLAQWRRGGAAGGLGGSWARQEL